MRESKEVKLKEAGLLEAQLKDQETKNKILDATLDLFNQKGLKFTMDDVAKQMGMSKKTLYTIFQDKEALFFEMVDRGFAAIKEEEAKIIADDSIDIVEKIERVMIAMPDRYKTVDLSQVYSVKDKYPKIYAQVEQRLESGWEPTISLLEQGINEGKIRPILIPILKTMVEGTIEQFFKNSVLVDNHISYDKALAEMMDIIKRGMVTER